MPDNIIVFYECWQMQCCGQPFTIGSKIKWPIVKMNHFRSDTVINSINFCYEAHNSDHTVLSVIEGIVAEISILYEKYAPSPDNPRLLIPVDERIQPAYKADGTDDNIGDFKPSGYIVKLSDYSIRKAGKCDITFC